ncbi:hypothetical protein F4824DRAFT_486466 [Ustulina deusta]|nr:hypothetical protein F4824DRAFT_486466 [Ustulina deusta]
MSHEDLHSFAEMQDPARNEQIELYIYTHFLIFTKTQSTESLDQAIQQTEGWLAVTPTDHPDRTCRFHVLDVLQKSSLESLNKAIQIIDQAIKIARIGSMDNLNSAILNSLGNMLGMRFDRTGSIDDLNCTIDVADQAVDATPADHPDRAARLNNFGNMLSMRFGRIGFMDNLNRAINVANQAVDATPADHPDRATCLSNLGSWLGRRFERTGSIDDLNQTSSVRDSTAQDP